MASTSKPSAVLQTIQSGEQLLAHVGSERLDRSAIDEQARSGDLFRARGPRADVSEDGAHLGHHVDRTNRPTYA